MSNQSNTSNDKPCTVQDIIHAIETKSAGGGYIYRGERRPHLKVSSNLYREYDIDEEHFDIEGVQAEMLNAAKKHIGDLPQDFRVDFVTFPNLAEENTDETINFELLTEIQHYGGKTNLIDFTTDYFIALFFACDGRHDKDGQIILQRTEEIKSMINHPRNPRHRVIAQKSVFVRPPKGFIELGRDDIVTIPANLKQSILQHLRMYHGISTETIYNDLYGFIRNQDIHGGAYTQFYRGFACHKRGDEATNSEAKQKEYEKSIGHYTKAIVLKPDLAVAYNNRGNAYNDTGDFDHAIDDLDKAIDLNPSDAIAYNNRGNAYSGKDDFDHAIEDYTRAIELKPDYAEAYNNRGNAYSGKDDFDHAIEDFNKAIVLKPDLAGAYNNRGNAYNGKDDFDRAIDDLDKAIDLNPSDAIAYNNRGVAYSDTGDIDRAIEDYTQAIDLNPDYAEAYNNRGNAYNGKDDFDRAIDDLDKAIDLNPDYTYAYNNRGNAYSGKDDFDRAIDDYTQAIDLNPDYAEAYNNRGVAYNDTGDIDRAIKDYTKAIELKPDLAESYAGRGEAWLHLGEWGKAKADLTTARDMGVDIIASFHNDYENVAHFESRNGMKLPADLAAMLTPQQ